MNLLRAFIFSIFVIGVTPLASADVPAQSNGTQLLEEFGKQQEQKVRADGELNDQEKKVIMFLIGVPLLLLLLITAGLGLSVGLYGKPWFVAHMVCAGLTVSLAVVHVIVGLVWFYPF